MMIIKPSVAYFLPAEKKSSNLSLIERSSNYWLVLVFDKLHLSGGFAEGVVIAMINVDHGSGR
jgi:hypothetical protein